MEGVHTSTNRFDKVENTLTSGKLDEQTLRFPDILGVVEWDKGWYPFVKQCKMKEIRGIHGRKGKNGQSAILYNASKFPISEAFNGKDYECQSSCTNHQGGVSQKGKKPPNKIENLPSAPRRRFFNPSRKIKPGSSMV
jgi:hypothetical protein